MIMTFMTLANLMFFSNQEGPSDVSAAHWSGEIIIIVNIIRNLRAHMVREGDDDDPAI